MLFTPEFENSPLEQQVERIRLIFIGQVDAYRGALKLNPNNESVKTQYQQIIHDVLMPDNNDLDPVQIDKQINELNRIFDLFIDRVGISDNLTQHDLLSNEHFVLSTTALSAQALRTVGKLTQKQYADFMTSKGFVFGESGGRHLKKTRSSDN